MAAKQARKASYLRKTGETEIKVGLALDGNGSAEIETGIPFLDHMLALLAKHGKFDLKVKARGDLEVDAHHTVEDTGISLGGAFLKALGDKKGIRRFGSACVPMDEALARVVVDLSGRPFLKFQVEFPNRKMEEFNTGLVEEFMRGMSSELGANLHIKLLYGRDGHHIAESVFKALALALDEATGLDGRVSGVPSTKGRL